MIGITGAGDVPSQVQDVDSQYLQQKQLRDVFIAQVYNSGFSCKLPAPELLLENRPSFGQYDEKANAVKTSDWATMPQEQKAFFIRLSSFVGTKQSSRQLFEIYVHRWTFVHEMAHWWQACEAPHGPQTPYDIERDANRITLAYWRQVDPHTVDVLTTISKTITRRQKSKLPQGQSLPEYFNQNDERLHLSSSTFYPWFQATLFLSIQRGTPQETFPAALEHSQKL